MLMVDSWGVYWDPKRFLVIYDEEQDYDPEEIVNPWWFAFPEDWESNDNVYVKTQPLYKAVIPETYSLWADSIINISSTPLEIERDWENNEDEVRFDYDLIRDQIKRWAEEAHPRELLKVALELGLLGTD